MTLFFLIYPIPFQLVILSLFLSLKSVSLKLFPTSKKANHADGSLLVSDHLIHALPAVGTSIAKLFTSILRHGYMPAQLHNCTLVPIRKGSKDPVISDNYHACDCTCPYSEQSIRMVHSQDHFQISGLQFGFKQKMSIVLKKHCLLL